MNLPERASQPMNKELEFRLKPAMGVDLVFNLDSMSPVSKSSIVLDSDETKKHVVVAQPGEKIQRDIAYNQMHISSLVKKELAGKTRLAYSCRIVEFIRDYGLSNQGKTEALLIEYKPPAMEINIRSAFRFQPNVNFDVLGKISLDGNIYYSGRHFKFHNISISGIGLLIPKKILKVRNPMMDLKIGSYAKMGVLLKTGGEIPESVFTLECTIKIVRMHTDYNPLSGFAGCSMIKLSQDQEETINRFIHNAQLHEIRKINRFK